MPMTDCNDARRKAEECAAKAQIASDMQQKHDWFELAESWSDLADSMERRPPKVRYIPPEDETE